MRIAMSFPVLLMLAACGGLEAPVPETAPSSPSTSPRAPGSSSGGPSQLAPPGAAPQGVPNDAPCPAVVAAPTDCGKYVEACAGAHPLAVGTFSLIRGLALDTSSVYWTTERTDLATCGGTIYRTPRGGGSSTAIAHGPTIHALEADANALYWISQATGPGSFDFSVVALPSGGAAPSTLGTFAPDAQLGLSATVGGVLLVQNTSIARLSATTSSPVLGPAESLASEPAYDGASLVASRQDGSLVRWDALTGTSTTLATGATTRYRRTVAIGGGDVFYVVGDDESDDGMPLYPMGIRRVSLAGGVPVDIVPRGVDIIDTITIDEGRVYFVVGNSIRAVPRAGGAVMTLGLVGAPPRDLHVDAELLYFRLDVGGVVGGEISAPGGIIATLPNVH